MASNITLRLEKQITGTTSHILLHVCQTTSTVRFSPFTPLSVPVSITAYRQPYYAFLSSCPLPRPLVLLDIRSSFKADLQASSAELVYGEPLRIPGEFLTQIAHTVEPAHLITHLRQHMACLPTCSTRQTSRPPT
jgi:hypothetical protein